MPKQPSPLKAIRAMCLQCVCGSAKEVELCTSNVKDIEAFGNVGENTPFVSCPLYEFRFGKNPARGGKGGAGKPFLGQNKRAQTGVKEESSDITS